MKISNQSQKNKLSGKRISI